MPCPVPYELALRFQNDMVRHRINNPCLSSDWLILLEHQPVYTTGRRETGEKDRLEAERSRLEEIDPKAKFVSTLRGGQTTYHGPGQLIGYPILNIGSMGMSARSYVENLLKVLKRALVHQSMPKKIDTLDPSSDKDLPVGLFVDTPKQKIASIGVQIKRRITSHGFSINVEKKSEAGFKNIVACGSSETRMISVESLLNDGESVKVNDMVDNVVEVFGQLFDRKMVEASADSCGADEAGYKLVKELEQKISYL
ncbi:hypothetical protein BY996DRAFT_4586555 [Phakopsora pachyrhizi]|nr:hypothetical protein BY996DRAFT_4586555 [Phakopsora pachyrhizi]